MRDVLASMHAAAAQHVAVGKRLGKLKGPLEHLVSHAPLPTGQGATWSAHYSVEVLHTS